MTAETKNRQTPGGRLWRLWQIIGNAAGVSGKRKK